MKKPQLFLLHFAGGNFYSFQFMGPYLNDFEVVPLELPGRGTRMKEDLLKDFDLAAKDIYNQVTSRLKSSVFLIYGHSMGAYLALRLCHMLEKAGKYPAFLIVSGNAGPGIEIGKQRYLLGRERFVTELIDLGGFPAELIENEDFFNLYEPILRADFEIVEKYDLSNEPVVNTPIYAIMGSGEQTNNQISNWSKFTHSDSYFEILEGDHFFIHKHARGMADIIRGCYNKTTIPNNFQIKSNP